MKFLVHTLISGDNSDFKGGYELIRVINSATFSLTAVKIMTCMSYYTQLFTLM